LHSIAPSCICDAGIVPDLHKAAGADLSSQAAFSAMQFHVRTFHRSGLELNARAGRGDAFKVVTTRLDGGQEPKRWPKMHRAFALSLLAEMANNLHLEVLSKRIEAWNEWRTTFEIVAPRSQRG
jgi:hypothetical protein